jgi:hypothetical protein
LESLKGGDVSSFHGNEHSLFVMMKRKRRKGENGGKGEV